MLSYLNNIQAQLYYVFCTSAMVSSSHVHLESLAIREYTKIVHSILLFSATISINTQRMCTKDNYGSLCVVNLLAAEEVDRTN